MQNTVGKYFDSHWHEYEQTIKCNTLYHREILQTLQDFLDKHFSNRLFSFVDVGCGDSSTIAPILISSRITKYIGIDAASEVLELAKANLEDVYCEKRFISDTMISAISLVKAPVDIIHGSWAIHHLSYQEKYDFIQTCKEKLNENGFLIMIDGILKKNQTRDEWLDALQARILFTQPHVSAEKMPTLMNHARQDDQPEEIATFADIAKKQQWKNFSVLFEQDIFAFMVFEK